MEELLRKQVDKIKETLGLDEILRGNLGSLTSLNMPDDFNVLALSTDETVVSTRHSILCGGNAINCSDADQALIEAYFEGSSHTGNFTVEILDAQGDPAIDPVFIHTNIFGRADDVPLGTIYSGRTYSVKITLDDQPYVLPKILNVRITNPTPTTIDGELVYTAELKLIFTQQFCFGDFDQNESISISDMFALRDLVKSKGTSAIFDIWDAINLDGIASFDISDMATLLKNFQCKAQVSESTLTLEELARMVGF